MGCILNVWLERRQPCLQVLDGDSRRVILHWGAVQLRQRFASGELCLDDLQDTSLPFWERLGLVQEF